MKSTRTKEQLRQEVVDEFRQAENEHEKGSGLGALSSLRASAEALLKLILLERDQKYHDRAALDELKTELLKVVDHNEPVFVAVETVQRAANHCLHHRSSSVTAEEKARMAQPLYRSGREAFRVLLKWYEKQFHHELCVPEADSVAGHAVGGPAEVVAERRPVPYEAGGAGFSASANPLRHRRLPLAIGIAAGLLVAVAGAAFVIQGRSSDSSAAEECKRVVEEWVAAHNRHDESAYVQHLVFPLRWFNRRISQADFVERRQRRDPNWEREVQSGEFQALRTCDGRQLFDWLEIVHKQGKRYDQRKYLLFEKTLDTWKIVGISEPDNHRSLDDICPPPGA